MLTEPSHDIKITLTDLSSLGMRRTARVLLNRHYAEQSIRQHPVHEHRICQGGDM